MLSAFSNMSGASTEAHILSKRGHEATLILSITDLSQFPTNVIPVNSTGIKQRGIKKEKWQKTKENNTERLQGQFRLYSKVEIRFVQSPCSKRNPLKNAAK